MENSVGLNERKIILHAGCASDQVSEQICIGIVPLGYSRRSSLSLRESSCGRLYGINNRSSGVRAGGAQTPGRRRAFARNFPKRPPFSLLLAILAVAGAAVRSEKGDLMPTLSIMALLLCLSSVFGFVNYRLLRLPSSIGVTVVSLGASFMVLGLNSLLPSFQLRSTVQEILGTRYLPETLLDSALYFLLFAGAL
jgi:hypothetical protein